MNIRFKKGSRKRLNASNLSSSMVERVIERIQIAVPHLTFKPWNIKSKPTSLVAGAFHTDKTCRSLRVSFNADGLYFEGHCSKTEQTVVSQEDHEFLKHLSLEAKDYLEKSGEAENSLFDFGSLAVSETLKNSLNLSKSPLNILYFLRGISQQTYENQRISYGIIV